MSRGFSYSLEEIKVGFERFHKENGHYPLSTEIESCPYLPSSRQIQRRFGGVVGIRKLLGLDCQSDFRTGAHSSARAKEILKRSHALEKQVYLTLTDRFGTPFVHREFLFNEDRRLRADFFVYDKGKGFAVDVFYPKDRYNLKGCLNSKQRIYEGGIDFGYPIILLMLNDSIKVDVLVQAIQAKEKTLAENIALMNRDQFAEFLKEREPLRICP